MHKVTLRLNPNLRNCSDNSASANRYTTFYVDKIASLSERFDNHTTVDSSVAVGSSSPDAFKFHSVSPRSRRSSSASHCPSPADFMASQLPSGSDCCCRSRSRSCTWSTPPSSSAGSRPCSRWPRSYPCTRAAKAQGGGLFVQTDLAAAGPVHSLGRGRSIQLCVHLEETGFVPSQQHGFCKGRSTSTAILSAMAGPPPGAGCTSPALTTLVGL